MKPKVRPVLPLGSPTPWGPIAAVLLIEGERYYMMAEDETGVSLMPADVVEIRPVERKPARRKRK